MHPFPTPRNHALHSVELDYEDGLVVLNAEMLINSLNPSNNIFNIGLYAFSGLLMHIKKISFQDFLAIDEFWESVERISGFQKDPIIMATGIEEPSQFQILSTLFFSHNKNFMEILPLIYDKLCEIYNFKTKHT